MRVSLFAMNLVALIVVATPTILILNSVAPLRSETAAVVSAILFAIGAIAFLAAAFLLSLRRPSPGAAMRVFTISWVVFLGSAVMRFLPL